MSTFGNFFRVSTFGESHCPGVGCVVDGVPPRMKLTEADIQVALRLGLSCNCELMLTLTMAILFTFIYCLGSTRQT